MNDDIYIAFEELKIGVYFRFHFENETMLHMRIEEEAGHEKPNYVTIRGPHRGKPQFAAPIARVEVVEEDDHVPMF